MSTDLQVTQAIDHHAWEDLFRAPAEPIRRALGLRAERYERALLLEAPGVDHVLFNRFIDIRLPEQTDRLRDALRRYDVLGTTRYFVQPVRGGPRAQALLRDAGLAPYRRRWVKFLRTEGTTPVVRTELDVRTARPQEAEACARLLVDGFDLPTEAAPVFASLVGRDGWHVEVAVGDGRPVGVGVLYAHGDAAALMFAATDPAYRGRGAQSALMKRRIDHALARGCRWIATETGEAVAGEPNPSEHNIRKFGFRPVAVRENHAKAGVAWAS
ncbi:MAG: GNAT family N-acetyltransferase, partial [Myxococcota bacterium]